MHLAFVYPHLLHGIEVYANTGVTHLTKLITLNIKYSEYCKINHIIPQLLIFTLLIILYQFPSYILSNRASAYGTPLDGATVKVVITTVNKT